MKHSIFKTITIVLISSMLFSCDNSHNEEKGNAVPKETGINLVENGITEYRIIYEKGASANIMSAASELSSFIEQSSGVTIPYEADSGEDFNPTHKVISLGNTTIFEQTGLKITKEMHKTGYYLKRFGNTLVINAKQSNGVSAAAYDMLGYTIGLEFYASDEMEYQKKDTIPLLDFDIQFNPYIDVRDILMKNLTSQYRRRMRLFVGEGKGHWITFAHTVITEYLPLSVYGTTHPEWYNAAKNQVCYSNEEMRHEMARQIIERVAANESGQYVMIGHEDNWDMCMCDACKAERELYGGYSGQELHFTNEISKEVDEWLNVNQPGRRVEYVFFAYQTSQNPPVKTEIRNGKEVAVKDSNGQYIPYYDHFDIRDDVVVIYCPIDADFSLNFSENENSSQYYQLKGWSDIFHKSNLYDNILIWSYSLATHDYMVPFNSFGAFRKQVKFYKDLGACYVMDQSNHDSGIPCFEALKTYTESKLMYNNNQDYNALAEDFINHYYGPAAEHFKEYFYFIRSHYRKNNVSGSIWQTLSGSSLWSLETLELMMSYFKNCLEDIEPLKETDPDRYSVLNDRLRRERLTPIYLSMKLYFNYLTQEQKEEYVDDLFKYTDKYDITETGEGQNDMEALVEEWKNSVYGA